MSEAADATGTIWIDGDAAPRACKEVVYKAAARTRTAVVLVANRHHATPRLEVVRLLQVPGGPDEADDAIVARCGPSDLVITDDLPLAARALEKGATVLRFRGEPITEDNVREQLGMRDFLDSLRGSGVVTGGPPPYGNKETQRFAGALDRWLARGRL
jgi:uncharacterized protein YaiI (UPF0178 family)